MHAQNGAQPSLSFAAVPVEKALAVWAQTSQQNLLYRPEILPDQTVTCYQQTADTEAVLRCIVDAVNLDYYQTEAGSFVVVERQKDALPTHGRLAGTVRDALTDEPLAFATVYLPALGVGTTTNEEGVFSLEAVPLGDEEVIVSYMGYDPKARTLTIAPHTEEHALALFPKVLSMQTPLVVKGTLHTVRAQQLGRGRLQAKLNTAAGSYGSRDVVRKANAIMGVTVRLPVSDLHIQGGEASEHQMQLDGMPVFNPLSLGRLLGAFSPLAIESMTIYKSGFGAAQGSQISGVVHMVHDVHTPAVDRIRVQADPLSVNGRLRIDYALPLGLKGSTLVALRKSLWDRHQSAGLAETLTQWNTVDPLLSSRVLELTAPYLQYRPEWQAADLGFEDVHVASVFRLHTHHKIHVSGYWGRNMLQSEFLGNEPTYIEQEVSRVEAENVKRNLLGLEPAFVDHDNRRYLLTRDQYTWSNRGGQVRYEGVWAPNLWGTLQVRHSRYHLAHAYKIADKIVSRSVFEPDHTRLTQQQLQLTLDVEDGAKDDNQNTEFAVEGAVYTETTFGHSIEAGFEVARASNAFRIDSLFFNPVALASDQWRLVGYWDSKMHMSSGMTLDMGLRLTGVPDRQSTYWEPRLALRRDVEQSPLGAYAWRLAGGIYRQFVSPFDVSNVGPSSTVPSIRFWLPIDRSVAPPQAYHLAVEALLLPHPYWQIQAEAYHKWQPHILSIDYAALFDPQSDPLEGTEQAEFIAATEGAAHGGGLRIDYNQDGVFMSLAYNYMHAVRRFPGRFENRFEPTPWNEPHRFSFSTEWQATKSFSIRMRTVGIWGRSWGFRQAYYDYFAAHTLLNAFEPYDLTNPSAHRLPPLRQLDLGAAYRHDADGLTLLLQADFVNVLNRVNVVDWSLERADNSIDAPFLGGLNTYRRAERTLTGFMPVFSVTVAF